MNWTAISAIGEILGALAVVVSLVYLAIQIRQNTHQVEIQSRTQRLSVLGSLGDQFRGFRNPIVSSPNNASIWRKGNQDPTQLGDDESIQFDFMMIEFFWGLAYIWMMALEQGLGDYVRDDVMDNIRVYESPGLRTWWSETNHRHEYPKAFVELIDGLLAEATED